MIKYVNRKSFSFKIPQNLEIYFKLAQNNTSILNLIPKNFDGVKNLSNFTERPNLFRDLKLSQNLIESTNAGILNPCWDLLERRGKKWRYALGLMIGRYLKVNIEDPAASKDLHNIAGFIEILHAGSLIIDDIEDKSEYRRFKKCVHLIYGKYNIIII
jgi:geranylgeranyl pyrophosphate synthase